MSALIPAAAHHQAQRHAQTTAPPADTGHRVNPIFEIDGLGHLWNSQIHPVITDLGKATSAIAGPLGGLVAGHGPASPGPGVAQQAPRPAPISNSVKTTVHRLRALVGI